MKTLGLIGGISWHSTTIYYSTINRLINERLGDHHSGKLIMHSVDFHDFRQLQDSEDWKQIEIMLSEISNRLVIAGAECIIICSNTPHIIAHELKRFIKIPLIHIAEETAKVIGRKKIRKVALLGTKFTMENRFFKDALARVGIQIIVPDDNDQTFIHESILGELSKGIFRKKTKVKYQDIISRLKIMGAEGVILGCTEIPLLLKQADCGFEAFDTVEIHCRAAVDFALS
jgi:aspartate racemase